MTVSENPYIRMINGDSLEAMKSMEDNAYELAIVDPPYGIGMSGGNVGYKGFNDLERKGWDNEVPTEQYFKELFRVSINQIIFGGNYFNLPPSKGFYIWNKGAGFKGRTYAEAEFAWASFKNGKVFERDPLCNGDYHGKIHPTQKPVPVYKDILRQYATEGDRILDTHGGSGSIAIACYDMGFDLDWYEIDEDYYNDAVDRFLEHKSQGQLFTPEEQYKPKQTELLANE